MYTFNKYPRIKLCDILLIGLFILSIIICYYLINNNDNNEQFRGGAPRSAMNQESKINIGDLYPRSIINTGRNQMNQISQTYPMLQIVPVSQLNITPGNKIINNGNNNNPPNNYNNSNMPNNNSDFCYYNYGNDYSGHPMEKYYQLETDIVDYSDGTENIDDKKIDYDFYDEYDPV